MTHRRRLPTVRGGALVEAIGGPLDGDILFLLSGEPVIHVWHFFDGLRSPTTCPVGDGKLNKMGWYSPGAAVAAMTQRVYWHPEPTEEQWEAMRQRTIRGTP